jgi:hypothetical protein
LPVLENFETPQRKSHENLPMKNFKEKLQILKKNHKTLVSRKNKPDKNVTSNE